MPEDFDLNKIRKGGKDPSQEKGSLKPEAGESREQKVARLEVEITELEAKVQEAKEKVPFSQLSPQEQAAQLEIINQSLVESERYVSAEEYLAHNPERGGPSLDGVRLAAKKLELERLRKAEG